MATTSSVDIRLLSRSTQSGCSDSPTENKDSFFSTKSFIICGYSLHGKDYLTSQLVSTNPKSPFEWLILKAPHINPKWDKIWSVCESYDSIKSGKYFGKNLVRMASADALKRHVFKMLLESGEIEQPEEYLAQDSADLLKMADQLNKSSNLIREGQTFNDILHEVSIQKSEQDSVYWIRHSYEHFKKENTQAGFVVSDWRFPNELKFLQEQGENPITIRVYQPAKEGVDTVAETSLDNVTTDYVLIYDRFVMENIGQYWSGSAFLHKDDDGTIPLQNVQSKDEFNNAIFTIQAMTNRLKRRLVQKFPQYADYEFVNI